MQLLIDLQQSQDLRTYTVRANSGTVSFRGTFVDSIGDAVSSEITFTGLSTTEQTLLAAYRTAVGDSSASFPGRGVAFMGSVFSGTLLVGFRGNTDATVNSSGPSHTSSFSAGYFRLGVNPSTTQIYGRGVQRVLSDNSITVGLTASALSSYYTPSVYRNSLMVTNASTGIIYGRLGGNLPTTSAYHFKVQAGTSQVLSAAYGLPIYLIGDSAGLSAIITEYDGNATIPVLEGTGAGASTVSSAGLATSAKQDSQIALTPAALDTGHSTSPEAGRLKVSVVTGQRVKFANIQLAAGSADVVYSLSFSKLDADGQRAITGTVATGTLSTANDSKTLATLYGSAVPSDAVEAYLSIDREARILNTSSTVVAASRLTLMHTLPAGGLYPLTQLF